MKTKLNLGCGGDIRAGWINLDSRAIEGVDVVHDINILPLPFNDQSIDKILCQDVLEHVEYVNLMKDLYRILKQLGEIHIRVPHFTSKNNYIDPTHKKMFSAFTFNFFTSSSYFDYSFSTISKIKITFKKGLYFYNYLIEFLVNSSNVARRVYESTCFCWLFPTTNIELVIKK
jgi:ubiquinone/menaquinone biosynthesis C-methylase UbiE